MHQMPAILSPVLDSAWTTLQSKIVKIFIGLFRDHFLWRWSILVILDPHPIRDHPHNPEDPLQIHYFDLKNVLIDLPKKCSTNFHLWFC